VLSPRRAGELFAALDLPQLPRGVRMNLHRELLAVE
jgi:hypothetical protein